MNDGLPKPSTRDFDLLRTGRRRTWLNLLVKGAFLLLALFLFTLFATYLIRLRSGDEISVSATRERVLQLQHRWSYTFVDSWDGYRGWFLRHGTSAEGSLFDDLSASVIDSMLNSNSAQASEEDLSGFSRTYLALHLGVVRLIFVIIASFRLALSASLLAGFAGLLAYRPYRGDDALGQMGNGRVYYSGVRAGLEKLTDEGTPDVQVRGFACPQLASQAEAKASALWRILEEFGAANSTNRALVQILVKNGRIAAYVPASEDEAKFSRVFEGSTLAENTPEVLRAALTQHSEYVSGNCGWHATTEQTGHLREGSSYADYGRLLQRALDLVLSVRNKEELATIPAAEIATLVLAFESGKTLAHAFEGGKWVRRSNFPHLSARAVLHSLVEYPNDYDLHSRTRIRRGLIYAARKSAFSPVRMPVDMSETSWVLRQWAEVLLACPHELEAVANEVELVGLVRDAHDHWCDALFNPGNEPAEKLFERGFSTATNLLVLPVSEVVDTMRSFVSAETIARMNVLLKRVAAEQAKQTAQDTGSESGPTLQLSFDRVHPNPSEPEIKKLAEIHQIDLSRVHDWLALRTVLSAYGWVASRVGDYSVPHSSLIFAVFRCSSPLEGLNQLGLLGRPGMVPLRGSKLAEVWGSAWGSRFTFVDRVTMAETTEDYGKLLQGIEELKPVEDEELALGNKV